MLKMQIAPSEKKGLQKDLRLHLFLRDNMYQHI